MIYLIAKPSEYIAVTGSGIDDIKLCKKGWIYPMQTSWRFDITPRNYSFDVNAMSIEKLPFTLPAVFTIGPRDEFDCLMKYAKLIADHDMSGRHVKDLIKGIVEGETRVLVAGMSMEEVFKGADHFKQEVFAKVQLELDQFGLHIYNANIKQLVDIKGQEYFSYLGQKPQQEAANQAKIDVAEAKYKGDIGAKERSGLTICNAARVDAETKIFAKIQTATARQQEVRMDAETKIYQNSREAEVAEANANLCVMKTRWSQQSKIADIESTRSSQIREAELMQTLEQKKAMAATEKLRGSLLSKATVAYEVNVKETNGVVYQKQRDADAGLYKIQTRAEGLQKEADAALYQKQKEADAKLYSTQKESEALLHTASAQAAYVKSMLVAFRGNVSGFHNFMKLDRGLYQELGRINANAIKNMEPQVSIWTTGGGGGNVGSDGEQNRADIYMNLSRVQDSRNCQQPYLVSEPDQ